MSLNPCSQLEVTRHRTDRLADHVVVKATKHTKLGLMRQLGSVA